LYRAASGRAFQDSTAEFCVILVAVKLAGGTQVCPNAGYKITSRSTLKINFFMADDSIVKK
jgi:hypothetical protein